MQKKNAMQCTEMQHSSALQGTGLHHNMDGIGGHLKCRTNIAGVPAFSTLHWISLDFTGWPFTILHFVDMDMDMDINSNQMWASYNISKVRCGFKMEE